MSDDEADAEVRYAVCADDPSGTHAIISDGTVVDRVRTVRDPNSQRTVSSISRLRPRMVATVNPNSTPASSAS